MYREIIRLVLANETGGQPGFYRTCRGGTWSRLERPCKMELSQTYNTININDVV